jgi:hypothetical protein
MDEQITTPPAESLRQPVRPADWLRQSRVCLIGAIVVVAVAAVAIIWAVSSGSGSSSTATKGPVVSGIKPVALTASGLRTIAGSVSQPIYWAGVKKSYNYELRRTTNGNVYIRYLPPGVKAGAAGADYLIVATYPFRGAFEAIKKVSGGRKIDVPGGGIGQIADSYPNSVHLAFPNVDYQVEVFDPSPERAREVASSGDIQPVG